MVLADKKNIVKKGNNVETEAQKPLAEPNSPKKQNSITKKSIVNVEWDLSQRKLPGI